MSDLNRRSTPTLTATSNFRVNYWIPVEGQKSGTHPSRRGVLIDSLVVSAEYGLPASPWSHAANASSFQILNETIALRVEVEKLEKTLERRRDRKSAATDRIPVQNSWVSSECAEDSSAKCSK